MLHFFFFFLHFLMDQVYIFGLKVEVISKVGIVYVMPGHNVVFLEFF